MCVSQVKLLFKSCSNKYHNRYPGKELPLSSEEFESKLISLFEPFKNYVQGQIISRNIEYRLDREDDPSVTTTRTLEEFGKNWENIEYRKKVIPGKDYFSRVNQWLNSDYKLSISLANIRESLSREEIDKEIIATINDFIELVNSR